MKGVRHDWLPFRIDLLSTPIADEQWLRWLRRNELTLWYHTINEGERPPIENYNWLQTLFVVVAVEVKQIRHFDIILSRSTFLERCDSVTLRSENMYLLNSIVEKWRLEKFDILLSFYLSRHFQNMTFCTFLRKSHPQIVIRAAFIHIQHHHVHVRLELTRTIKKCLRLNNWIELNYTLHSENMQLLKSIVLVKMWRLDKIYNIAISFTSCRCF